MFTKAELKDLEVEIRSRKEVCEEGDAKEYGAELKRMRKLHTKIQGLLEAPKAATGVNAEVLKKLQTITAMFECRLREIDSKYLDSVKAVISKAGGI